jgi:hypothetical protein
MELSLSLNTDGLVAAFNAAPQVLRDHLIPAVWSSAEAIQREAQANHHFTSRTGNLQSGIKTDSLSDTTARVYLETDRIPYAASIHDGSRAHWIKPLNKSFLRWPTKDGGWFYALGPDIDKRSGIAWMAKNAPGSPFMFRWPWHPGTKADPFLYAAAEAKRQDIENNINAAITTSLREAGL